MAALQYPQVLFTRSTCGPRPVAGPLAITLLHPSKTARPRAGKPRKGEVVGGDNDGAGGGSWRR